MSVRVTKYDPSLRDHLGRYVGADWTSISQVGTLVGGALLSAAEYIRVEDSYIHTLMTILAEGHATEFRMLDLEVHARQGVLGVPSLPPLTELAALAHSTLRRSVTPAEARPADVAQPRTGQNFIELVARACLREELWCRLAATDGSCEVHFGYDYYLYVTGLTPSHDVVQAARARGIFVEQFDSPYGNA